MNQAHELVQISELRKTYPTANRKELRTRLRAEGATYDQVAQELAEEASILDTAEIKPEELSPAEIEAEHRRQIKENTEAETKRAAASEVTQNESETTRPKQISKPTKQAEPKPEQDKNNNNQPEK